jgi:S1-C subfamily serine protease
MKRCLLFIFLAFSVIFMVMTVSGQMEGKTNLYENMVSASVLISDDFGHGSGVFIDDNVILTAAHCIKNLNFVSIELSNGEIIDSNDFYIDGKEDIGFIFVDVNELHIPKISLSPIDVGDTVYLVGNPYHREFKFTLIKGILSHLDRDIPEMNWKDLLQTDADGGKGYSGGPLYNSNGDLIGMYVGQCFDGGRSISLCESAKSILEAYKRYKDAVISR